MEQRSSDNDQKLIKPQGLVNFKRGTEVELRQAIDTTYEILRRYHDSLERDKRTDLTEAVEGAMPVGMAHLSCEAHRTSNLNEDDGECRESSIPAVSLKRRTTSETDNVIEITRRYHGTR